MLGFFTYVNMEKVPFQYFAMALYLDVPANLSVFAFLIYCYLPCK